MRVLVDAFGSMGLPDHFWAPLRATGGEARWFNPAALMRFSFRNHRKLLVCDGQVAFVGGFNITHAYVGDGVHSGWRDPGLRLEGPLAAPLAASFDEMFARAEFRHKRFTRLRRFSMDPFVGAAEWARFGFDPLHQPESRAALSPPGAPANRAIHAKTGQDFVEGGWFHFPQVFGASASSASMTTGMCV